MWRGGQHLGKRDVLRSIRQIVVPREGEGLRVSRRRRRPELRPALAGVLPQFVAFLVYSEAGVFDPVTRTLTGTPLGWKLSNYEGVADGRDEFKGTTRTGARSRDRRR